MPANYGTNPYQKPGHAVHGEAPGAVLQPRWGGPGRYSNPTLPDSTEPTYTTAFSPSLATAGSSDGTMLPDDIRTNRREPPPNDSNNILVTLRRWSDKLRRQSEEKERVREQPIKQRRIPKPTRPIWDQDRPNTRPLQGTSPYGGGFQREWHIPRNIAEEQFPGAEYRHSLADHRRVGAVHGMAPRGAVGVNQWRPAPMSWDTPMYVPMEAANPVQARVWHIGNSGVANSRGGVWR